MGGPITVGVTLEMGGVSETVTVVGTVSELRKQNRVTTALLQKSIFRVREAD